MKVLSKKLVITFIFVAIAGGEMWAQVNPRDVPIVTQPQQRFDSGQDVQPIFEGWTRNADGSFMMHFGYLNRNYRELPSIPVGSNNFFSPGDVDRGQPTIFYPRTQRYQFVVRVPSSMGTSIDDGVVWTVTRRGSTQRAIGWLQPEWEIDVNTITSNNRTGFGRSKEQMYANEAPTVMASIASTTAKIGESVGLFASVNDDDLPSPLPPRKPRTRLPALIPPDGSAKSPDNIRWYRKPSPPRNGLSLLWVVHRGPVDVKFEPAGYQRSVAEEKKDEEVDFNGRVTQAAQSGNDATHISGDGWTSASFEASVTFDTPGTYTLRALASDAMLVTPADVTIMVE